ncbi:MAG TPA: DUF4430 domain-containing protein [Solirubrobacterales bacterium]|nr:DUF4430 domain-containing protein [Solirubrobacterales bacterium]
MQLRTAAVCVLALCLTVAFAASASAKGFTATLRVVGAGKKVLAEQQVKTVSTVSLKTSKQATCFGSGTGGSGKSVAVPGNTALGLLGVGAKSIKGLAPLSLTDHFSFGLGLCAIGKSKAKDESSWYLKVNHKGATTGAEKTKIKAGDEVLFDLAPGYPYPEELVVVAPEEATAGVPFTAHVYAYDEKGKRKPVQGAAVTGAIGPTDKQGKVSITLTKPTALIAGLGEDIPSAAVPVCLAGQCPAGS